MLDKIIPQPPDPKNPFKDDKLFRSDLSKRLSKVLLTVTKPFVVALNAPYGTGKTHFVERWKLDLELQEVPTFYFNAWQSDFSQLPLVSFISDLQLQMKCNGLEPNDAKVKKLVASAGGYLLRKAFPVGVKLATAGILDSEDFKEIANIGNGTTSEISSLLSDIAEEQVAEHQAARDSIDSFRSQLKIVRDSLTKKDASTPIVIFVDDLDRCRPSYSIELLECIKHLFSVDGYIFVLAVDHVYLAQCVKSIYGQDINGSDYLRKFFDWQLTLPTPDSILYASHLADYFRVSDVLEDTNSLLDGVRPMVRTFGVASQWGGLALRAQEQIFTSLNLALRVADATHPPLASLLAAMAIFRETEPPLYTFMSQTSDMQQPARVLNQSELTKNLQVEQIAWLRCVVNLAGTRGWENIDYLLDNTTVRHDRNASRDTLVENEIKMEFRQLLHDLANSRDFWKMRKETDAEKISFGQHCWRLLESIRFLTQA